VLSTLPSWVSTLELIDFTDLTSAFVALVPCLLLAYPRICQEALQTKELATLHQLHTNSNLQSMWMLTVSHLQLDAELEEIKAAEQAKKEASEEGVVPSYCKAGSLSTMDAAYTPPKALNSPLASAMAAKLQKARPAPLKGQIDGDGDESASGT
jgi:hypothetical protein